MTMYSRLWQGSNCHIVIILIIAFPWRTTCQLAFREELEGNESLVITSNGFPNQKYVQGLLAWIYYYRVRNSNESGFIQGTFLDFDLAPHQKIEIFYGPNTTNPPDEMYPKQPHLEGKPDFISTTSEIVIKFFNPTSTTDDEIHYIGWRLNCTFHNGDQALPKVPFTNCGTINPMGGTVDFHDMLIGQRKPFDCIWSVKVQNRTNAFVKIMTIPEYGRLTVLSSNNSLGSVFSRNKKTKFISKHGLYIRYTGQYYTRDTVVKFGYTPYVLTYSTCSQNFKWRNDFCCDAGRNRFWRMPRQLMCDNFPHCYNGDDEVFDVCQATYGGTAKKAKCKSRFYYGGVEHKKCILGDKGKPWCYTNYVYGVSNPWGYCYMSKKDAYPKTTTTVIPTIYPSSPTGQKCSTYSRQRRCPDGGCVYSYPRSCTKYCSSYSSRWKCNDGYCTKTSYVCDGIKHCFDGSDESHYACNPTKAPFTCGYSEWKCPYKDKCIQASYRCDDMDDCGDNSDEQSCGGGYSGGSDSTSGDSMSTMGTVGIIIAVVVACSIFICCIICRKARSSSSQQTIERQDGAQNASRPHVVYHPPGSTGNIGMTSLSTDEMRASPVSLPPPDYGHHDMFPQPSTPLVEPSAPPLESASQGGEQTSSLYEPPPTDAPAAPPPAYTDVMSGSYNLYVPGEDPVSSSPQLARR